MTKADIVKFLDAQPILILTTMDAKNTPQTRALINIRNKDISPYLVEYFKTHDRILLMTNTHSDKIAEMKNNDTASLYAYDNEYKGLSLTGRVIEILDEDIKDIIWNDALLHYYPDGRHGGDFSVIEFIPQTFKTYDGSNHFAKTSGNVE